MIERMQFLSISGPKDDIDRVTERYLSKYEIQLENALSELGSATGLKPFIEENPYKDALEESKELLKVYGNSIQARQTGESSIRLTTEEARQVVEQLEEAVKTLLKEKAEKEQQLALVRASEDKILPFRGLNYDIEKILKFQDIKVRFGKMPKEYFKKFTDYVYETIDTIMMKCVEDEDYVWLVYFVPEPIEDRIDAIYTSLHFERFYVPDEYVGTPDEVVEKIDRHIEKLSGEIAELNRGVAAEISAQGERLLAANAELVRYAKTFGVRKLAACTKHDEHTFYILCGWIPESDAKKLRHEIDQDQMVYCLVEKDHSKLQSAPPTKLKNPGLLKPFEMYIQMYGLPSYHEMDPTWLVAITYSVLFGFMFGDVGQGLCLMIGGFLLYRLKKINLAGIIACCGVFSTLFGFLFGSIFGFEEIIEAHWLRPAEAMTQLPFIGNLNTVFVVAIALGMGIILLTMLLNIANSVRNHDLHGLLFSTNGVAGLVFYAALVVMILLYMTGRALPATAVLVVMFVLPLLLLFFQEPLTELVERKTAKIEGGAVMFVVQGFFELFEVLLSYFSNTLSFVRVGAFAVSHAAMMQVVLMLAGAESGSINWLVVVLGNLFVCGMEGLIVGIQVLRLEYYELFSRFYSGTGRAFVPYGREG